MAFQVVLSDLFTQSTLATVIRCSIFLLYFHPLSSFPGPRIAAISNVWYGYHWLSGRYPWAIEDALRKYGPVVRIAPNELAFYTPQAFTDIYSPHFKNFETFVKTDFQNRGKDLGGLIWEEDPPRHRKVARKLSPAFSSRSIRTMEPLVHKYMDYFVIKMKDLDPNGVALAQWTNWLAMDLSADLAWNAEMYQMRHSSPVKDSVHLDALLSFNKFATVLQVFKRFPLLRPFQYLFVPLGKVRVFSAMEKVTGDSVLRRIDQRGSTEHEDYFDHILPADSPAPTDSGELLHIGSLALQVMFAGWGPMGDLFHGTLALLLAEPDCYKILVKEIRGHFEEYNAIMPAAVGSIPHLYACVEETHRLLPSNSTGLPRISPGVMVDGRYIPKGTHSYDFHEPLRFQLQRWLPYSHPLYDPVFAKDHLKSLHPFSLGPRICLGREMAWMQGKLFLAKVLWMFDIVKAPNQHFDLDKTLLHYGFFEKPELRVRFLPVKREKEYAVRNEHM
ncbi:cytochrome P450 [Biscogniauxia marginata]|nr:cytochrome P450 [Biscogniauxia marginata]